MSPLSAYSCEVKIPARKCTVTEIPADLASDFLAENHRQGAVKVTSSLKSFGLMHDGSLIGVVQFCYPRTSAKKKKYTVELLRLAFKNGVRVPGGASKLVSHYRKTFSPSDMFTYQAMDGEGTSVYEHCGFVLVKKESRKKYLLAPGATLATGARRDVLGMAYAVRYGPDRILNTNLGEVIDEDTGQRKSNLRIFTEDLGWRVEEGPGDRVYEWFDPNVTFYTYRIMASDSEKYYYGVSHVKKANATADDCLTDGYMGGGGKGSHFQRWKKKHRATLIKTVVNTYPTKSEAYRAEELLVGDLWRSDPLCLNSAGGGKRGAPPARVSPMRLAVCEAHGTCAHMGSTCMTCASQASYSVDDCPTHGLTIHGGGVCKKCTAVKSLTTGECDLHGFTAHRGGKCVTCKNLDATRSATCLIHGDESTFQGEACILCVFELKTKLKACKIHGIVKHYGETCCQCTSAKRVQPGTCAIHGVGNFLDGKCAACENSSRVKISFCPIHGDGKHQGSHCLKCKAAKALAVKSCLTHGESTHIGNTCILCISEKTNQVKNCPTHGRTSHQGEQCTRCVNEALVTKANCPIHGVTNHRGSSCYKCSGAKKRKPFPMRECSKHGLAKHLGNTCAKCSTEKRTHNAKHKEKVEPTCQYCVA